MKKILLLGNNGFIGKNLSEFFSLQKNIALFKPSHSELDLLKEDAVKEYLCSLKPDIVINAAICRNPKYYNSIQSMTEIEQNVRMFLNLEKYNRYYGKMLCFGSGAEFNKDKPICSISEDDFSNGIPKSEYGFSKYLITKIIEKSINIYNLRIFGLFGKYENWKTTFISGACCKAIKNIPITIRKNVVFDYLYINDLFPIIQWFIENEPLYHSYNISSGKRIDLLTIARKVKQISGSSAPIYVCNEGLANEYTASNKRLNKEYKDFTLTDIDISIQKLLAYYRTIEKTIDLQSLLYQY